MLIPRDRHIGRLERIKRRYIGEYKQRFSITYRVTRMSLDRGLDVYFNSGDDSAYFSSVSHAKERTRSYRSRHLKHLNIGRRPYLRKRDAKRIAEEMGIVDGIRTALEHARVHYKTIKNNNSKPF